MKKRAEMENKKKYFTELARQYEENNFLIAAAVVYRRYDKKRIKKTYLSIAKSAQMNGLYEVAAYFYDLCGKRNRAESIRNYIGSRRSYRISNRTLEKILFSTTRFEREGDFDKARKYWLNAAKYCEMVGEQRFAAIYYFKCGSLSDAKRMWRNTQPQGILFA